MIAPDWKDYRILGSGDGLKLELWKDIMLLRPDPQAIWRATVDYSKYDTHARYVRDRSGGGRWIVNKPMPEEWTVKWRQYAFGIKPTGFKHTGLFPEQAVNWDRLSKLVESEAARGQKPKILNLFAYTGAATAVLAKSGGCVTHVDAAKGMVERAHYNCKLNGVPQENNRFIVDDCKKFVAREIKRGKTARRGRRGVEDGGRYIRPRKAHRRAGPRPEILFDKQLYDGTATADDFQYSHAQPAARRQNRGV